MADTEKKKNAFRDMILIVFVVLICFGLTIYGIVYLTGKVFSSEEKIEIAKIKAPHITTDPEEGDILTFSSKPETVVREADDPAEIPPAEPENRAETKEPEKPAAVKTQQYAPRQPEAGKPIETAKPEPAKPAEKKAQATPGPAEKQAPAQAARPKPAKGAYAVQIMAVTSAKDAEREAAKFRNSCPDVFVQKADLGPKGVWYRVRCGATDSKEEAVRTRNMLASKFKGVSPQVVSGK